MGSDNPVANITIRTALLVINCIALGWIINNHTDWLLILNLFLILIIQIVFFVRYQFRNHQRLDSILSSLEYSTKTSNGFDGLRGELSEPVIDRLRQIENRFSSLRLDIEKQNRFLQAIIDNMRVGVIAYDEQGKIELINQMALKLLQMKTIRTLDQINNRFPLLFISIQQLSQRQPVVHKLRHEQNITTISLKTKNYRFLNKPLRILTMHVIQQELEEQEIDSWQKLIRVLTHEIMNSTGPISSTLDTLIEILSDKSTCLAKQKEIVNQEMLADVVKGLYIIKGRSEGLAHFVQHFRSLTLLPKPVPEHMDIETFFIRVLFLFQHVITEQKIKTEIEIFPSHLNVNADPALLEQVLINLLKNSIEAVKDIPNALILLKAYQEADKRIAIEVIDNGIGIQEELLDQVLIPFFSTKQDGSGIGLSISRQIIRMHGGTIVFRSEPKIKTIFKITL